MARIEFVATGTETTLLIDGAQAMQGWEDDLMRRSADVLCEHGSEFLEVGLGLGLSALHIAAKPTTRRHVVVELHQPVVDHFLAANPDPPAALEIVLAEFSALLPTLPPASVDGIFFDPYLPAATRNDPAFWNAVMPPMIALLRPGGVFVPCFNTRPYFHFLHYFDHATIERRHYASYPQTTYTAAACGDAFIQCYFAPGSRTTSAGARPARC
jgi:spermidine synthase